MKYVVQAEVRVYASKHLQRFQRKVSHGLQILPFEGRSVGFVKNLSLRTVKFQKRVDLSKSCLKRVPVL
jgi:hypothetical protein